MRVILAIIGAIAGLSLASSSHEMFGIIVGALAGFGAGELGALRGKLKGLEEELGSLRKAMAQQASRERESRPTAPEGEGQQAPRPAQTTTSQPTAGTWEPYGVDATAAPRAGPLVGRAPTLARSGIPSAPAATARPSVTPSGSTASSTRGDAPADPTNATTTSAPTDDAPSTSAAARTRHIVQPHREDFVDAAVRVVREYFTGGNTLVRVGVIILFFGVAFLLRYAAEHSHVPIEFRLSGVALGGIVLLVLGWRLRTKRAGYALALQGGAVGILYLTIFAGLKIYSVLPAGAAFALLVVVAAFSAALAILQNSQSFAFLAVSGGFLAPILASTGKGDHVMLFSYYAILNGGILAIAWFKAWRPLNVLGFLFTFVIGTAWGVLSYQPQLFATTEPFLVLFFLFYVAIAILFASRQPPQLRGYVDGTLVFGTPIVAFGLQSAMLHDRRFVLAFSALAVSALYLALATLLHRTRHASYRLLVESFMALGVLFLTLAVPLALDGRWSAATWALEGAALVWIGCRQDRRLPRAFGSLLQIAGGVIFLFDIQAPQGAVPLLNSAFLGGAMVSAASVFSAGMLERHRDRLDRSEYALAPLLYFWGVLWWLFTGSMEIHRRIPHRFENAGGLLLMALTALLSSELVRRARISFARYSALALLPMMIFYALLASVSVQQPFADGGWLSWPVAFAAFYFVCKRHEGEPGSPLANALHVGSLWLLAALASWQLYWWIDHGIAGGSSWPTIAWALVPAVILFALPKLKRWPFTPHRTAYRGIAALGLAFYLALWSVGTNVTLPGNPYPLPFVPLLNPLDLAEFFVLLVLLRYWLFLRSAQLADFVLIPQRPVFTGLAVLAFVWLNAALLRSVHHLAGVPFEVPALVQSNLVETAISIFWTVIALTTMLVATRKSARVVWLTAAGLLGVVIAKLFLVDLSHVGTVERIVSFVGVGVLMLVIGYFSPLPPALEQANRAST
ncbi:MAG: DUF2339 domain-containing protein [Proteobacteria bacterium]|nr:DUF2339 domain-containing protein [Pseudomonadota bacterium]